MPTVVVVVVGVVGGEVGVGVVVVVVVEPLDVEPTDDESRTGS